MRSKVDVTLWAAIILGIVLRFVNMMDAPVTTDEAQFMLGVPHSQPPLIFWLFTGVQWIFGPDLMMVRGVTALVGIAGVAMVYVVWKELFGKENALLATAVAALVPAHIAFSRVAYLDVYLVTAWLLLAYAYIRAIREERDGFSVWMLFHVAVLATLIKSQGFFFIGLLLLHRIWIKRRTVFKDPLALALTLALIPIVFYFLAHPQVLATSLTNVDREAFGLSPLRFVTIVQMWWEQNRLFVLLMLAGLPFLKRAGWVIGSLCFLSLLLPFLFGPSHPYYATYTFAFALLAVFIVMRLSVRIREAVLLVLGLNAFLILGPHQLWQSPWQHGLFQEKSYWNENAAMINGHLESADSTTVVTPIGHEARWYLEPTLWARSPDDIDGVTGFIVQFTDRNPVIEVTNAEEIFRDDHVLIQYRPPSP